MIHSRLYKSDITIDDRVYLFQEASVRTGLPAYIVEKDYIVSLLLSLIFTDIKPHYLGSCSTPFLFKGGTSLSKIFNVINRMSEDIDLSVNMHFLGFPEPESESNSARDRRVAKLKESNIAFVRLLQEKISLTLQEIHSDFEVNIDSGEPQNLIIQYPRSLSEADYFVSYLKPQVLIETGGRAAFEPHESRISKPIMINEIQEKLEATDDCCSTVDVLSLERTFFEKLTLLHELNNRGEVAVTNRQARHLYDLIQIYQEKPEILGNTGLLEDVRDHKSKYFRRSTARWDQAKPGTLLILPPAEVEPLLREDWEKMTDFFPNSELPYSFEQILEVLSKIDAEVNSSK